MLQVSLLCSWFLRVLTRAIGNPYASMSQDTGLLQCRELGWREDHPGHRLGMFVSPECPQRCPFSLQTAQQTALPDDDEDL